MLRTLGAPSAAARRRRRGRASRRRIPRPVPTSRATVVARHAVRRPRRGRGVAGRAAPRRARRSSRGRRALRWLNRALRAHRAAAADPYVARGLPRPRARGAARLRRAATQVADGPLRRGLELPRRGARRGSARWRLARRSASRRSLGGRDEQLAWPRSSCCEPAPTSTPAARARRRSRRGWRSRPRWRSWAARARDSALTGGRWARPQTQRWSATRHRSLQEAVADAVARMEFALRRRRLKQV